MEVFDQQPIEKGEDDYKGLNLSVGEIRDLEVQFEGDQGGD